VFNSEWQFFIVGGEVSTAWIP